MTPAPLLHKLTLATEKKNKDQHPVAATILCDLQGNVKETDIAKDSEINLSGKDFVGMNIFSFLDEELRKTAFLYFQKVKQNSKRQINDCDIYRYNGAETCGN